MSHHTCYVDFIDVYFHKKAQNLKYILEYILTNNMCLCLQCPKED